MIPSQGKGVGGRDAAGELPQLWLSPQRPWRAKMDYGPLAAHAGQVRRLGALEYCVVTGGAGLAG